MGPFPRLGLRGEQLAREHADPDVPVPERGQVGDVPEPEGLLRGGRRADLIPTRVAG